ncbi:unnamed protein product [Cyprideis torosa]|uniref:Uncharacterized protein n=1 Tax=Cyprideis torosa TaxID=163714 RepID=A0A7R8ZJC8_9CRUS|nr:unnamed protein product [Cyprideis torosa]CAG0886652.1 unnamed protein product [Cyprideis torosa]
MAMSNASESLSQQEKCLMESGLVYKVRFVGSLSINVSMKSLSYESRLDVAVECIRLACEAAKGPLPGDWRRKTTSQTEEHRRLLSETIGREPNLEHTWEEVEMKVTASRVSLCTCKTREVIASHEMPSISFASAGDAETSAYVAYVAKDEKHGRTCFVLECGSGLSVQVINALGQAFQLRYREVCKQQSTKASVQNLAPLSQVAPSSLLAGSSLDVNENEAEYYNDMPGKVPPDISRVKLTANPPPPSPGLVASPRSVAVPKKNPSHSNNNLPSSLSTGGSSSDLIDFNSESRNPSNNGGKIPPLYMNEPALQASSDKDPFDMQPFGPQSTGGGPTPFTPLPSASPMPSPHPKALPRTRHPKTPSATPLESEPWFFGPVSRSEAEALVVRDGEFLVRESQGIRGQYVLTGMNAGCRKHLLLVDPEGVVRTKDRAFDSVSHLIRFHRDNALPIVSADSELFLLRPARKPARV